MDGTRNNYIHIGVAWLNKADTEPKTKVIEMIEGYRYLTHEEYHDDEYIVMVLRRMTDNEEAIE